MVQFAPAARLLVQVLAEIAKSPGFTPMREPLVVIVRGPVPVFFSVTTFAAVVVNTLVSPNP